MKRGNVSANLADNVAALRRVENLSQRALAQRAGIPRSTLTHIESGAGNPSLENLTRLSTALGVGIEELLATPRSDVLLIPADRVPVKQRGAGRVRVHDLLPERVRGLHIERMELDPGGTMRGTPHVAGTREYLHVVEGAVTVLVSGELHAVNEGAVLAFRGDQSHSYMNRGRTPARALSVVVPFLTGLS